MLYAIVGRLAVWGAGAVALGYGLTFFYIWVRLFWFYHGPT